MAAAFDNQPTTLAELPEEQRALLLALDGRNGPARARDLADAARVDRRGAGQRLDALAHLGLVIHRDGTGPTQADHVRVYELTADGRDMLANHTPDSSTGAVIHDTVLADRTRPSEKRALVEVNRALDRADQHLVAWFNAELSRVYIAGVSDGFAQGVAAEAAARSQEALRGG